MGTAAPAGEEKVGQARAEKDSPAERAYVVQRGLRLAKYKNRLIDIRIFLQRPASKWLIWGQVVRVGAPGRFVTNYHQGGRPEVLEKVMASLYKNKPRKARNAIRYIRRLSITAAQSLSRRFPGIRQLGMDIAVDKNRRIWIIEANTSPAFLTFKHFKNKLDVLPHPQQAAAHLLEAPQSVRESRSGARRRHRSQMNLYIAEAEKIEALQDAIITLSNEEKETVGGIISRLPPLDVRNVRDDSLLPVKLAGRKLPERLMKAMLHFGRNPNPYGTLMFRNLPVDPALLPHPLRRQNFGTEKNVLQRVPPAVVHADVGRTYLL